MLSLQYYGYTNQRTVRAPAGFPSHACEANSQALRFSKGRHNTEELLTTNSQQNPILMQRWFYYAAAVALYVVVAHSLSYF